MELRRLTMTFFLDMEIAPLERQTETIIGSISGGRPTATAIAKKNACQKSCLVNQLINKTKGTITNMKRIMSQVKRLIPLSKAVSTGWPAMLLAMLPKKVCEPVTAATAVAVPLSTLVPRKQRLQNSMGEIFCRV